MTFFLAFQTDGWENFDNLPAKSRLDIRQSCHTENFCALLQELPKFGFRASGVIMTFGGTKVAELGNGATKPFFWASIQTNATLGKCKWQGRQGQPNYFQIKVCTLRMVGPTAGGLTAQTLRQATKSFDLIGHEAFHEETQNVQGRLSVGLPAERCSMSFFGNIFF